MIAGEPLVPLLRSTLPLFLLGALWFWGASPLLNAIVTRQQRRENRDFETLSFSDAGFLPSAQWSEPMPWSFVDRVTETKRFLFIYHGYSKDPVYIPKHALSADAQAQLRSLLEIQFKSRANNTKLLAWAT
jgi:hypothetical protein